MHILPHLPSMLRLSAPTCNTTFEVTESPCPYSMNKMNVASSCVFRFRNRCGSDYAAWFGTTQGVDGNAIICVLWDGVHIPLLKLYLWSIIRLLKVPSRIPTFFLLLHLMCFPRPTLPLPPTGSSDPGSHSRLCSPLPTTVHAFIFIARRIQHFHSWSTRVELCLRTLLGALSSWSLFLFFQISINSKFHHGGIRTPGPTLVAFDCNH